MFYSDSLEVFKGVDKSLKECSGVLSNVSLDDFRDKLNICKGAFFTVNSLIDTFLNNWEKDNDKIYSTLDSIKNYIEYYERLCKTSTELNYKPNAKYIVDSINTLSLVINMKIKCIEKDKFKSN